MVKFGIGLVPEEGCGLAVRHSMKAEQAGFEYIFMSDHLKGRSVHVCLTAAALQTERITIGPGVTNPYTIHPIATAQILASLNEIAPNRIVCGIGAGDEGNLRRIGVKQAKPIAAVREATRIIRDALAGGVVDIDGQVFEIRGVRLGFPGADRLPILIGAQGDRMLRLAGGVGDGVIVNAADPAECERAMRIVRRGGREAGRSLEGFEWAAAMPFSVAGRVRDALSPLRPKVAVVAAGCDASVLERHGIPLSDVERVRGALRRDDYREIVGSVTPEMIDSLAIAGTPEDCREKIRRLIRAGVTLLILAPPLGPVVDEAIDLAASEVLPRVR